MQSARRILAVLLLLALTLGIPVLSAHAGAMAGHAVEAMADQAAPVGCADCGSSDMGMSPSACFAGCIGVQADASRRDVRFALGAETFHSVADQRFIGAVSSPEPYPPKPTVSL